MATKNQKKDEVGGESDDVDPALILITVPHATCPFSGSDVVAAKALRHPCDVAAEKCARAIDRSLTTGRGRRKLCESKVLVGSIPRTSVDLNRSVGTGTEWRREARRALASPRCVCLLDVHSFPPGDFDGRDFVVMNIGPPLKWHFDLVASVAAESGFAGSRCGTVEGSTKNDILADARRHGVPAALLEFSEGLSEDAAVRACRAVARFVLDRFVASTESLGSNGDVAYVVTVPHATCPPLSDEEAWESTGNHACDPHGPIGAALLRSALMERGKRVVVLESPTPRTVVDMNRSWSRRTGWRRELRRLLSERPERYACLVDSHSYPATYGPWRGSDVVFMNCGDAPTPWQADMCERFCAASRGRALTATSSVTTDVVADAQSFGVPAVLIEFSEGLSNGVMTQACGRIADYLVAHEPLERPRATRSVLPPSTAALASAFAVGCHMMYNMVGDEDEYSSRRRSLARTVAAATASVGVHSDEDVFDEKTEKILYVGQCKSRKRNPTVRDRTVACESAALAIRELVFDLHAGRMSLHADVASVVRAKISAATIVGEAKASRFSPGTYDFFGTKTGTEELAAGSEDDIASMVGQPFDVASDWLSSTRHLFRRRYRATPIPDASIVRQLKGRFFDGLLGIPDPTEAKGSSSSGTVVGALLQGTLADEYLQALIDRCTTALEEDDPSRGPRRQQQQRSPGEFVRRAIFSAVACGLGVSKLGEERKRPPPASVSTRPVDRMPSDSDVDVEGETDVACFVTIDASKLSTRDPKDFAGATVAVATIEIRSEEGLIVLLGAGSFPDPGDDKSKELGAALAMCARVADDYYGASFSSTNLAIRVDELEEPLASGLQLEKRTSKAEKLPTWGGESFPVSESTTDKYAGAVDDASGFFFAERHDPIFAISPTDLDAIVARLDQFEGDVGIAIARLVDSRSRDVVRHFVHDYDTSKRDAIFGIVEWAARTGRVADLGSFCASIVAAFVVELETESMVRDVLALCSHFEALFLRYGRAFFVAKKEGADDDDETCDEESTTWTTFDVRGSFVPAPESTVAYFEREKPASPRRGVEDRKPNPATANVLGRGMISGIRATATSRLVESAGSQGEEEGGADLRAMAWDAGMRSLLAALHRRMTAFDPSLSTFSSTACEIARTSARLGDLYAVDSAFACAALFGLRADDGSLGGQTETTHAYAPMILRRMALRDMVPPRIERKMAELYLVPILLDPELRSPGLFVAALRAVEEPAALEIAASCAIGLLWERDATRDLSSETTMSQLAIDATMRYKAEPYDPFGCSQPSPSQEEMYSSAAARVRMVATAPRRGSSARHLVDSLKHVLAAEDEAVEARSQSGTSCKRASIFKRTNDGLFPDSATIDKACGTRLATSQSALFSATSLRSILARCAEINERAGSMWACVLTRDPWRTDYARRVAIDQCFGADDGLPIELGNSWARVPAFGMAVYGMNEFARSCAELGLLSSRSFHEPIPTRATSTGPETAAVTLFKVCTIWKGPDGAGSRFLHAFFDGIAATYGKSGTESAAKTTRREFELTYGLDPKLLDFYDIPSLDGEEKRQVFNSGIARELAEVLLRPKEAKSRLRTYVASERAKKKSERRK